MCIGGGPERGTRAEDATWPFTPGSGGNRNRTAGLAGHEARVIKALEIAAATQEK
jgi:hypothetical protein